MGVLTKKFKDAVAIFFRGIKEYYLYWVF